MSKAGLTLAALTVLAFGSAAGHAAIGPNQPTAPQAQEIAGDVLAQATQCRGGYRIIHQVESKGRTTGGVIVRC
jgi:hypothetical protein